jgi:hypothetical protein
LEKLPALGGQSAFTLRKEREPKGEMVARYLARMANSEGPDEITYRKEAQVTSQSVV